MSNKRLLVLVMLLISGIGTFMFAAPAADSPQVIRFEIWSAPGKSGGGSADQISIQFSNTSADRSDIPGSVFFDILQEFSFSGIEAKELLSFDREVRDTSFLNARFVRVINHGGDGWAGDAIAISLGDGKSFRRIVEKRSLYPRRGTSRDGGMQDFNRTNWKQRIYWEEDLQKIRADRNPVYSSRPSSSR